VQPENVITVEGLIVERLSDRLCRVELANGHRVLAHAARRDLGRAAGLAAGRRVTLEMSPCDMSQGRLRWPTVVE
jgi:translation initiation factor IF-1